MRTQARRLIHGYRRATARHAAMRGAACWRGSIGRGRGGCVAASRGPWAPPLPRRICGGQGRRGQRMGAAILLLACSGMPSRFGDTSRARLSLPAAPAMTVDYTTLAIPLYCIFFGVCLEGVAHVYVARIYELISERLMKSATFYILAQG
jgi:hypothetical protein